MAENIRRWAKDIAGPAGGAERLIIVGWSQFETNEGKINLATLGKDLEDISFKWLRRIHSIGKSKHDAWLLAQSMNRDLFAEVTGPRELPNDGDWNHPEDVPF